MRALVSFTLQRKLHTNMRRTQLMGYLMQPGCSGRPAGCISGGSTFVILATPQLDQFMFVLFKKKKNFHTVRVHMISLVKKFLIPKYYIEKYWTESCCS